MQSLMEFSLLVGLSVGPAIGGGLQEVRYKVRYCFIISYHMCNSGYHIVLLGECSA